MFVCLFQLHYFIEPFCVSLKRTLPPMHPLNQILKYHCRETIIPTTFGTPILLGEAGFADVLFAYGNDGAFRILQDIHTLTSWEVTDFRKNIKVCSNFSSVWSWHSYNTLAWPQNSGNTKFQTFFGGGCSRIPYRVRLPSNGIPFFEPLCLRSDPIYPSQLLVRGFSFESLQGSVGSCLQGGGYPSKQVNASWRAKNCPAL